MGKASIKTTIYNQFKGVDFTADATLVDKTRSPYAVNIISAAGGRPEKRPGYRTVASYDSPVNGAYSYEHNGETQIIVHAGTKLYRVNDGAELFDGMGERSAGAYLGGKLYIVGGAYVVYDGETAKKVSEDAYIPTTVIAREPSGGGTAYENINMLTPYRRNAFQTDGETKTFQLDTDELDEVEVTAEVWGEAVTAFTVDYEAGTLTLNEAPAKPAAGSEDGLVVTFAKTVEGYAERIANCTIMTAYGVGTSDRLVLSGNSEYKNLDWISGYNDPSYFPDLNYSVVGIESAAIMGYARVGEYLAIVKEDDGHDTTIFFRSASVDENGNAVFPLKQAIAGVGAVAYGTMCQTSDEPLFLSRTGVFGITANTITNERLAQNRSYFINGRLSEEANRQNARAVFWNGMYLLGVNGHVYVLDCKQNKTYRSESMSDYVYECYYWENITAKCWLNAPMGAEEALYFGTEDGRLCRMNTDIDSLDKHSDDGAAIYAVWSTKADDDGDPTILKTMIKKGCAVTLAPYTRSSAHICFRTDRDPGEYEARYGTLDIFDWEDIDFSRFTFNANDGPQEILFNSKVKKYKRLQIFIKNDAVNEGFGIFGITKHYVAGNFAKR